MKFTDGYWAVRPGIDLLRGAEVVEAEVHHDKLVLLVPTRRIHRRGDTLNTPLLTVEVTSPAAGVAAVRLVHHRGGRQPVGFDLARTSGHARTRDHGDRVVLRTGELEVSARVGAPVDVSFRSRGRDLTRLGRRAVFAAVDTDGTHHVGAQLDLAAGEHLYGLGERFTPFVRNGQVVETWNADAGTSSDQAYKSIPFLLSDRGYGVLVDHPGRVSFELGSEVVSRTQFSVPGQVMEFLVVDGPDPAAVLRRFTALAGRPARPPAWSFGLWLTTSFTTDYDEGTVRGFLDGMASRDLPLRVFHFDCFWMRPWRWVDFEWDPATFPEPEAMLARLRAAHDVAVCVWINPYVGQASPLFREGHERGYLLRCTDGSTWQWDQWQAGMGIVDFTNPAATAWYLAHLRRLLDQGVDCFKTDFGERIPVDDVAWHDGSDPAEMHNRYPQLYNEAVFGLLEQVRGRGEAVVFARSATVGGQRFPVHWGGDCESTFASMAETLRGGLSLALSGFAFWSHDIGGFEGTPEPEVFKRWCAFGLLSSHSRLHGSGSYRVPWLVDDEAVDVLRRFTRLKMRLMPELYRLAVEAERTGLPLLRPMLLEHPADPTAAFLDRQYQLGPNLLVAPVLAPGGEVTYWVPAGTWTSLLTGAAVTGPAWHTEVHAVDSLPLLVRPGALVVTSHDPTRPDVDWTVGPRLVLHRPADGHDRVVVPDLAGGDAAAFEVEREGPRLVVRARGIAGPWSVLLLGVRADVEPTPGSTDRLGPVLAGHGGHPLVVRLPDGADW